MDVYRYLFDSDVFVDSILISCVDRFALSILISCWLVQAMFWLLRLR
ncbi:hypothetical protein VCR15J2_370004 [Vibrio coralliirubri]|nr:hypothetical protein VCR15J2_370004 [Vibrio coralliirubri]